MQSTGQLLKRVSRWVMLSAGFAIIFGLFSIPGISATQEETTPRSETEVLADGSETSPQLDWELSENFGKVVAVNPEPAVITPRASFYTAQNGAFSCGPGDVTTITRTGEIDQIGPNPKTNFPNVGATVYNLYYYRDYPSPYDRQITPIINGLGISQGGHYAYVIANYTGLGGAESSYPLSWREFVKSSLKICYFNGISWTCSAKKHRTRTNAVAGAIDLETGNYYFGGYDATNTRDQKFIIYRYDHAADVVYEIAHFDIDEISTAGGPGGDMTFDREGNLSVLQGQKNKAIVYTVSKDALQDAHAGECLAKSDRICSRKLPAPSKSKTIDLPAGINGSGIAYDDDGRIFLGGGDIIKKFDLVANREVPFPRGANGEELSYRVRPTADLASCAEPPTIKVTKSLPHGYASVKKPTEAYSVLNELKTQPQSFTLKLLDANSREYGTKTATGKAWNDSSLPANEEQRKNFINQEVMKQYAGPFVVPPGTYRITESNYKGQYYPTWTCTDQNGEEVQFRNPVAGQIEIQLPDYVSVNGQKQRPRINCTVINDPRPNAFLEFSKKIRPAGATNATRDLAQGNWPFEVKIPNGTTNNKTHLKLITQTSTSGGVPSGSVKGELNLANALSGSTVEFGEVPNSLLHAAVDTFQNYPEYQLIPGTRNNDKTASYCEYTPYLGTTSTYPVKKPFSTLADITGNANAKISPGDNLKCTFVNQKLGSVTLKIYDENLSTATNKVPMGGAVYELWESTDNRLDGRDRKISTLTAPSSGAEKGQVKWTGLDLTKHYFVKEVSRPTGYENTAVAGKDLAYKLELPLVDNNAPREQAPHVLKEIPLHRSEYVLSWNKIDLVNKTTKLSGSAWKLEETADLRDTFTAQNISDCTGGTCHAADKDNIAGAFRTAQLPWGTYKLTETTVPAEYKGNWPIEIKIAPNGTTNVRVLTGNGTTLETPVLPKTVTGTNYQAQDSTRTNRTYKKFHLDITNAPKRDRILTWNKVDGATRTFLGGSSWTFSTSVGTYTIVDCVGTCPETSYKVVNGKETPTYLDSDPVEGKFKIANLTADTYGLQEKTAPTGYALKTTAEKPINHTTATKTQSFGNISNFLAPTPPLPLTGGTSTDTFVVAAGIVFLLALGTGVVAFRRRCA